MPPASLRRFVCSVVLGALLFCAGARADAAVLYDLTLAGNGQVGPVRVLLELDGFIVFPGLIPIPLSNPAVLEASVGTPLGDESVIAFDVLPAQTRIGLAMFSLGNATAVLLTRDFPADFFTFDRSATETGTFVSTGGLVESELTLDTTTPLATLVVTQVPEPATTALVCAAVIGVALRRRARRSLR